MNYIVRLNPKALNPITRKVDPKHLWEVEQEASKDSEKVIWHCEDLRIGDRPIREFFVVPPVGTIWELHYKNATVARGQDNAIVILGEADVKPSSKS